MPWQIASNSSFRSEIVLGGDIESKNFVEYSREKRYEISVDQLKKANYLDLYISFLSELHVCIKIDRINVYKIICKSELDKLGIFS